MMTSNTEIQDNLDAIRKAEAAAEQTMREMGIEVEKESDSNGKPASRPTQSKEILTKTSELTGRSGDRGKTRQCPTGRF